jgi:hypothetical protein
MHFRTNNARDVIEAAQSASVDQPAVKQECDVSRSGGERRSRGWRSFAALGMAAAVFVSLAGCQRDPLEKTISAETPRAFATWQARFASDSNPEIRVRFNEALQEIRLKITGDRELNRAMGKPDSSSGMTVDEALAAKVNGRPLRDVLQLGYELRVARLTSELRGLEDAMRKNEGLVTRPGDLESKHHLEGLRDRQQARIDKYRKDIAAAEKEVAPLKQASGKSLLPPSAIDNPDEMPLRMDKPANKVPGK